MSSQGSRDQRLASALSELGLCARVEIAGGEGELAVLHPAEESDRSLVLGELREQVVAVCRRAGFRYVTMGLDMEPGPDPE